MSIEGCQDITFDVQESDLSEGVWYFASRPHTRSFTGEEYLLLTKIDGKGWWCPFTTGTLELKGMTLEEYVAGAKEEVLRTSKMDILERAGKEMDEQDFLSSDIGRKLVAEVRQLREARGY